MDGIVTVVLTVFLLLVPVVFGVRLHLICARSDNSLSPHAYIPFTIFVTLFCMATLIVLHTNFAGNETALSVLIGIGVFVLWPYAYFWGKTWKEHSLPPEPEPAPDLFAPVRLLIDHRYPAPPPATRERYKEIALALFKEDPTSETAKTLAKCYTEFVGSLPSHLQFFKGDKTTSTFPVTDIQLDKMTVEALYELVRNAPGKRTREVNDVIRQVASKEQSDWINLKGVLKREPEALLGIISWSRFSELIPTLVPAVNVPQKSRFEGAFILGPPGSGKTTLIQYLITQDIKDTDASVVVMDSQSKLIADLASLRHIQDRVILVEPGAVALNPFSMKGELGVDLITFILGALGGEGAALTSKQSSFYRPCIRLLLEVPQATFTDFYKLLQPDGLALYAEYIPKLADTVQLFFTNEFNGKGNAETKTELMWRLRPITEDPVYERMFCSPETKLDLFSELDQGKVILIDTDKQGLGAVRSSLFGRMFVAFLYRAAMQRTADEHPPVYVYIDEAHEYLQDEQIADMLDEVRKRRLAITLATQRLDKVKSTNMKSALMSTAVKYIRAGNDSDAHTMAREMRAEPYMLSNLQTRSFALFVRDQMKDAIAITVPDFDIKLDFEHVSIDGLKRRMKQQYGAELPAKRNEIAEPTILEEEIRPSSKL